MTFRDKQEMDSSEFLHFGPSGVAVATLDKKLKNKITI